MRRAILTIGSTAAGLAALLSFKTHTSAADVAEPGRQPGRVVRHRRAHRARHADDQAGQGEGERDRLAREDEGDRRAPAPA